MDSVLERLESRTRKSQEVFQRTREVVAQEVVGTVDMPYPLYIEKAKGSRMWDVDGNEYIDMTMGFGPHILGHAPDVVVDAVSGAVGRGLHFGLHNPYQEPLASLMVEAAPCADKVVFMNSGTEATMYGVRVARSYTGKNKIGMFDGGYHGAHDQVLAGARREAQGLGRWPGDWVGGYRCRPRSRWSCCRTGRRRPSRLSGSERTSWRL